MCITDNSKILCILKCGVAAGKIVACGAAHIASPTYKSDLVLPVQLSILHKYTPNMLLHVTQ